MNYIMIGTTSKGKLHLSRDIALAAHARGIPVTWIGRGCPLTIRLANLRRACVRHLSRFLPFGNLASEKTTPPSHCRQEA